jgi:hypothetical protein
MGAVYHCFTRLDDFGERPEAVTRMLNLLLILKYLLAPRATLIAENMALRQQVEVLKRHAPRLTLRLSLLKTSSAQSNTVLRDLTV